MVFFGIVLLSAACSSDTGGDGNSLPRIDEGEVHRLEEEAVQDCMSAEGFEYEMIPYVELGASPISEIFGAEMDGSDEDLVAYGGVSTSLQFLANPTGAPPENLEPNEVAAYDAALLGDRSSVEDGEVGGCRAIGYERRRELVARSRVDTSTTDGRAKLEEFFARVAGSDEYAEYSDSWAECIAAGGWDATDPLSFGAESKLEYLERSSSALDLERAEGVDVDRLPGELGHVIDEDSLKQYLSRLPSVAEVYRDEVDRFGQDTECRRRYVSLVEPVIATESVDVFGFDFSTIGVN